MATYQSCSYFSKLSPPVSFFIQYTGILNQLGKFDENVRSTLVGIIHSPIPDDVWSQAVLSYSYGGLGLGEATMIAPAAFTASCTMVRYLVVELLPNLPTDDLGESFSKKMVFDFIAQ